MPIKDRNKRLAYRRIWYLKNKKSELAHVKRRKSEIRSWFNNFKSNLKCKICYENHPATIEFHHRDRKFKNNEISKMVSEGYSINAIEQEIKKCEILCSNCHRKEHYKNDKL